MNSGQSVYDIVGEEALTRLVAAFYKRIPGDTLLGPMYPAGDFEAAEKRLRDFLVYRFGGPQTYIEERGHPRLRRRHFPFAINEAARDRWIEHMDQAFEEVEIEPGARDAMKQLFDHVATFLINRG
jgi:hemoglobin